LRVWSYGYCQVNFSKPEDPIYPGTSCGDRVCPRRKGAPTQFPVIASGRQVATEVEKIVDGCMDSEKSLRLLVSVSNS
jgi:hypothetical protein